jgi:BON domain-containing protein
MNIKSLLSSFVIAIVLAAGLGCAKKLDDAKMSSDIQTKYSQDSGLSTKQLSVQANNGVVTLSGTVDNDAQRDAAGRQAASIPGVKTVINNLQIGDATAAAAPAPVPAAPTQVASNPPDIKPEPGAVKKPEKTRKHKDSKPRDSAYDANNPNDQQADSQQMASNDQTPPAGAAAPPPPADVNPPPPPPPPPPKKFIVDQGTQMTVRLVDAIDSEKNQTGDTFKATLNAPLTSDGEEVVPAGADISGHLVSVKSAGKFAGQSEVVMQLDSLTVGGKTYNLQTDQYRKTGSSRGKNTAEKVGGGAVIGSIIGALAGGGKGAAIGAAAGAGVGGGVQAATKSQQIKFPSETVLNFTLQAPVTVVQAPGSDANRPKLGNSQ